MKFFNRFYSKLNAAQLVIAVFIAFPLILLSAILIKKDSVISVNENRVLTARRDIRTDVLDGGFQKDLESYLSDQFPMREGLKRAEVDLGLTLRSGCIGDAYVGSGGRLFQKILPGDVDSAKCVRYAARVNRIAEETGIGTYVMYVPSAGVSLREYMPAGAPMYDDEALFSSLRNQLKTCRVIDLRPVLSGHPEYYYATDHHWTAAGAAAAYAEWRAAPGSASGAQPPELYTVTDSFRGTLWSRVPSERIRPEKMQAVRIPDGLHVEADGKEISLYDPSALGTKDKYNFFEGGNHGILTVENPAVKGGKTLLICKDSFANSFLPFLVNDYQKIVMVDERYAFLDVGQLALDSGADEIAVIREMISAG